MTLPLAAVGIAFVLIFVPKVAVSAAQAKTPGGFDNKEPRVALQKLTGWGARAQAAHNNGFESFAPFAASVFVSLYGRANPIYVNVLCLTYLGARLVYPFIYIAGGSVTRSLVWGVGMLSTVGLFALPLFGSGTFGS